MVYGGVAVSVLAQPNTAGRPDYNPSAAFYRKHWCSHYHEGLLSMLARVLLSRLTPGAVILDVCCGAGTVARNLVSRGFAVTGVDASDEMLRYAARDVPKARFLVRDARAFDLPSEFDAAICTFDSLSYMLDREDLMRVFSCVRAALKPGGLFVFDLSLEETYKSEWLQSCAVVEEDEASFVRGTYDAHERIGHTNITTFHRNGVWERTDVSFMARCYSPEEVLTALERSGFAGASCSRSDDNPELRSDLGPARACFVAQKPRGTSVP
jgi:SAM-dependent methyltransferase